MATKPQGAAANNRAFALAFTLRDEPRAELRKLVVYRFDGSFDASMASESEDAGSSDFVDAQLTEQGYL